MKPVVTIQMSPNTHSNLTVLSFCPITGYEAGVGAAVLRSFEPVFGASLPQYGSVDIQWPVVPLGQLFSDVSLKDEFSLSAIIDEVISHFNAQYSECYDQVVRGQRKLICIGYSFGAYLATLFAASLNKRGQAPAVSVVLVDQEPPGSLSALSLWKKLECINFILDSLNLRSVSLSNTFLGSGLTVSGADRCLLTAYIKKMTEVLPHGQERRQIYINVFVNFFIMCNLTLERIGCVPAAGVMLLSLSRKYCAQEIRAGWKQLFTLYDQAFVTKAVTKIITNKRLPSSGGDPRQENELAGASCFQSTRYAISVVENPGHFDLQNADVFEVSQGRYFKFVLECIFNSHINVGCRFKSRINLKRTLTGDRPPLLFKRPKKTLLIKSSVQFKEEEKKTDQLIANRHIESIAEAAARRASSPVFFKSINVSYDSPSNSLLSIDNQVAEAVGILVSMQRVT